MDIHYFTNRRLKRMLANILSIFVILAVAFPITRGVSAQEPTLKVGLVVTESGIADNGFNLLAYQGLQQAQADMNVTTSLYTPADQNGYGAVLQQCTDDGNELCIAVGFLFGVSLANVARANLDTKWAIVDWSYPDCWEGATEGVDCGSFTEIPNVRGLRFNEKQAGYLAGVLAGAMTTSNVVGAVGGMEIPPVVAFVEGYRNGAQCTNPDVNVLTTYIGTFSDPGLGASTAEEMIAQGADVIFGAAGLTGNGAILYGAQNDQWAIGVDTDQYLTVFGDGTVTGSGKILSSAMKRVDNAVYQTIEDYVNGAFTPGTILYDLATDGVGLAPFHETDSNIPQEVKGNLEIVRQGIIDGMVNIDACPWLIAFPENDAVEGWEWPEGATVKLTIDNASGLEWSGTAAVTTWGDPRTFVRIEFGNDYNLQIGDTVTLSDEFGTTRTHTVQNLSVTNVDPVSNVVGGTADPEALVQVWPHENGLLLEDAADGNWQVDFTGQFDLVPGTCGRSQILVEANATAVDWCAPKPSLVAFPESDAVDGWEWPAGKTVTLTIDNAPEGFYREATAEVTPWGDPRTYVRFEFSDEYDLQVGDQVTLTGEDGITRTHTVQNLAITRVNAEDNLIKGTADAGAEVHVWPHATGQELVAVANPTGKWNVDFSGIYDLAPGDGGRSEVRDEVGNATAVDWYIPNPHFGVRANVDQVEGWEWAEGERVTLKIDNPDTGGGTDYTATQTVGLAPWDPNQTYVFFNLWNVYNIQPGDVVSLSNGPVTKTTTVTNLAFTNMDIDLDVVTGVATPNSHVDIWACDNITCINRHVDADGGGVWTADFANPGDEGDEQETFNIVLRTWIDSSQGDEDGDQTYWGQNVPNPYIEAAPYSDWIHAREWPLGTLMTLEIDDPSNGLGDVDYSATATMQQAPWNPNDPNDIVADFRWPDQFAPGPGYVLTMSGNGQSKTLTISQLNITGFELQADTISGTGTPNAQIQVCANVPNRCITRWVTAAEGSGNWTADYGVPGTGNDDPDLFDIQPGSNGWAAEYEADSDRTWFDWYIPNPRFTIFPLWQWYDGYDWPNGATVNITVAGKPDCDVTKTSWNYFFNGGFSSACHVDVGDTITFEDGTTTRTQVVRNLAITAIDLDKDTISGTTDAGATVYVWPHDGWFEPLQATANNLGKWQVDLGNVGYDILEGAAGRAEIRDEFGNATAVDWNLNARIVVQITDDWFRAEGFAPNTSLNFQIYEALGGKRLLKAATSQTDSGGSITHWVGDQLDIVPGNYVIVSDGKTSRDLVVEDLAFDVLDTTVGTLQGTAPEPFGRTVSVGIGCWQRDDLTADTTTDDNGNWMVDFQTSVPNDFGCVFASIYDADGDVSEVRPATIIHWDE